MQEYDYTSQHRPGTSMGHVDALSRCHQPIETPQAPNDKFHSDETKEPESPITQCRVIAAVDEVETIHVSQCRDPIIVNLRNKLEAGSVEGFKMIDGLVSRETGQSQPKLYPREVEDNIIRLIHEKLGHMAFDKTMNNLSDHYWFPGMRQKIATFIQNCIKSVMYAAPVRPSERNLYCIKHQGSVGLSREIL